MAQPFMDNSPPDGNPPSSSPPEARPQAFWKWFVVSVFLVLAVWIVFGQTLRYDFVNYDDDAIVYENPAVTRGVDIQEIVWVFTHSSGRDSWFPLTDISHMLDWQLYGPDAGGHHLTNVLLHAATAIVLFLLLQRLTGAIWRSAFVAAVFALHPLRVESVAWVAERKDVLSGLFFMLALWTWARHVQNRSAPAGSQKVISAFNPLHWTADYFLALLCFILGLLSKAMLVTLPFVMLLLDFWPLKRLTISTLPRLLAEKWPFFLVSAAGCAVTVLTQQHVVLAARHFSLPWRMGNSLLSYAVYLKHTVYPAGLALLYPHPENQLPAARVCLAAAILLIISIAALLGWRKHPYLLMGWFWFLGMFVPVIGMMQTGDQSRADRYTYLPQIGLFILLAWGAEALTRSWPGRRRLLSCAAGFILAALMAAAYQQTTYWKNSLTLWNRTLALWPESYIAHCNLGIALADEGQTSDAVRHFNRALELNPDDAKSINNLGKVLTSQGKLGEAMEHFNHALQLDPNDVKALNNLGVALADQGKWGDAIQQFNRALQLQPQDANACFNLANAFAAQQDFDDADQNYELALQINPDFADAQCNYGLALARQGKWSDAILHDQQAIRLKPHYIDALNNLGGVYTAQGDWADAVQSYQQVLQLTPNDPKVLNNLGVALARQGNPAAAIEYFNRALQINPNDPSTHNNLGITLAKQGNLAQAIQHLQQALYLARAQNNLPLEEAVSARLKTYENNPLLQMQ
jgi:tetratricopeptide (TPR) repeat protein